MLRALLAASAAALLAACATGSRPPPAGTDAAAAREVLARFVRAVEAERFDDALALSSARWRRAYTPGRLALDWRGAGAGGREQLGRVGRALGAGAGVEVSSRSPSRPLAPGTARLPLGDGTAAVLLLEDGAWRVDALDAAER